MATLLRALKYGGQAQLADGAAAYLVAQWARLEWPCPDVIVPVPISLSHLLGRGYNQSLLLAEGLAKILGKPVLDPLKRSSDSYSQAGLTREQRRQLKPECLSLKTEKGLENASVLLVDDVITSGATLQCCAQALAQAYPQELYALSVCRA